MDIERYRQRVYEAWIGKCIGGNMGFNLECYKEIFDFTCTDEFAPDKMYPNDDLDIQLAWLDLLLDKEGEITSEDLLEKFIDCYHYDFSEYGYAKRNYKRGIMPPHSGSYNNYFKECMGCAIRSEIWALVSCCNTELAVKFAKSDAVIDHAGESVEAEKYLAAAESLAFTDNNLKSVLTKAFDYIDKNSLIYKMIENIFKKFESGESWKDIIQYLHNQYGSPDGTYVVINIGIMITGLLFGKDDFDKVMTYTLNGGYDTDCTCATAGALFAIIYGIEKIDRKWVKMADAEIVTATKNLKHQFKDLSALADSTVYAAKILIEKGINTSEKALKMFGIVNLVLVNKDVYKAEIEYPEGYEIKPDSRLKLHLNIANGNNTQNLTFAIKTENDYFKAFVPDEKILLEKNENKAVDFEISALPANEISDKNLFEMTISGKDGKIQNIRFGIAGQPAYRFSRLFADGFDFEGKGDLKKLPQDAFRTYGKRTVLFHTDPNEYTNNWVRVNHEYKKEIFDDETFDDYFAEGRLHFAENDFIRLDKYYRQKGPVVVYAFQKLVVPTERTAEFHIGSTDPYKIWINGELITKQDSNWFYSPYNQRPRVKLLKGINRIAIKLVRNGSRQKFAYVIREDPFNHVGAISTDIKYLLK